MHSTKRYFGMSIEALDHKKLTALHTMFEILLAISHTKFNVESNVHERERSYIKHENIKYTHVQVCPSLPKRSL